MGNLTNSDLLTEFVKKLPRIHFFQRPDMSFFPGATFAEGFPSNGGHEFQPKGRALAQGPGTPGPNGRGPRPGPKGAALGLDPGPGPGTGPGPFFSPWPLFFGPWALYMGVLWPYFSQVGQ